MNPVFHAQCTLLEKAILDLPYVSYVDATPTPQALTGTSVIVDFDSHVLTLSHLCEIAELVVKHLGEQRCFTIECGDSTLVISGLKFNPQVEIGVIHGHY